MLRLSVEFSDHALVTVFFFKQKTAYELRISDWSSYVCSSDLRQHRLAPRPVDAQGRCGRERHRQRAQRHRVGRKGQAPRSEERRVGKSVSVRVDLGGRRIIKKKTKKEKDAQ